MKILKFPVLFFCIATFYLSCTQPQNPKNAPTPADSVAGTQTDTSATDTDEFNFAQNDTLPVGDVNGDGQNDLAILVNHDPRSAADSEYVTVSFTCAVPPFVHTNGFHGLMANAGDLDGNGTDELIYYPDWYQSNWGGFFIYGYRGGKWELFGNGTARRDIVGEAKDPVKYLQSRVKKIDNHRFRITDHVMDEETADIADSVSIVHIP